MSALNLALYEALVSANVPKETASQVVNALQAAIHKTIEHKNAILHKEVATKGDIESTKADLQVIRKEMSEMETRLMRTIVDMQRWTIGALIVCAGIVLAISRMV